jgi:hypothetical protein
METLRKNPEETSEIKYRGREVDRLFSRLDLTGERP